MLGCGKTPGADAGMGVEVVGGGPAGKGGAAAAGLSYWVTFVSGFQ